MQQQNKRMRFRALAIGAVIGSVISIGAVSTASAAKPDKSGGEIVVVVDEPITSSTLRAGIRW